MLQPLEEISSDSNSFQHQATNKTQNVAGASKFTWSSKIISYKYPALFTKEFAYYEQKRRP